MKTNLKYTNLPILELRIVLSNSSLNNAALSFFTNLKKTQGFDVEVVSFREGDGDIYGINGAINDDLRNYLINYYSQNQMLEYVLLVGDENQSNDDYNIPPFIIPSYNEGGDYDQTDYRYTFWGNDTGQNGQDAYSPKFFIGRWSVANLADLANIVVRNVNYADLSFAGLPYYEASRLNNALVVAGSFSDAPEPSGEGIIVNISTCGICGTDMHLLESGMHLPHIAGHEISGFLNDGSPVAIEPLTYCGSCRECKEGKYNLCSSKEFDILGATTDGGMAEKMIVPEHCLVNLNKEMDIKILH